MRVHHLSTVDAHIVFDIDGSRINAGGTRFAPDVTAAETALLARAMTYKFALLEREVGGAKGAVRGESGDKSDLMNSFCAEIKPLVDEATFLTGPDLGTSEQDFATLRSPDEPRHVMATTVGGVPFEDLLTGFGVVAAADAATGGLAQLRFAIEGLGKVGGGVAREAVRRGARVVAVSTLEGCVADPAGLDVELMLELRKGHGDGFVHHLGRNAEPAAALFSTDADVIVPGARTGVIDAHIASTITARHVIPAANVPYTADGLALLRSRRVVALADFVCNSAAVLGYLHPPDATPGEVFREVEQQIAELVAVTGLDPRGPYEGACSRAEAFIATWVPEEARPSSRPLA